MSEIMEHFCEKHGISATSVEGDKVAPDWPAVIQPTYYKVTLKHAGRKLTTDFWQGSAIREAPTTASVLYSLCQDACSGEVPFEDFCHELGYDTDSRRAERIHKACVRMVPKLRRFLGDLYDEARSQEH